MAVKATTRKQVERRAQSTGSVAIKPKKLVDLDDVLTPVEEALLKKAEREMKQGKFVTLDRLHHDLAGKNSPRRRKTA
jgi:hypothetical protein